MTERFHLTSARVPPALWALWLKHRAKLPALSTLLVEAMESALRSIDVEPPPRPEPGRMDAAHEARRQAQIAPPKRTRKKSNCPP
jgi:hypothetical protein